MLVCGRTRIQGTCGPGRIPQLGAPILHLAKSAILEAFSSSQRRHAFFHHIEDTTNMLAANTPKYTTLDRRNTLPAFQCLCGTIWRFVALFTRERRSTRTAKSLLLSRISIQVLATKGSDDSYDDTLSYYYKPWNLGLKSSGAEFRQGNHRSSPYEFDLAPFSHPYSTLR